MKLSYDQGTDALYVRFADKEVEDSEEVRPGVILDFDAEGKIVALEVLDASKHLSQGFDLKQMTAAE